MKRALVMITVAALAFGCGKKDEKAEGGDKAAAGKKAEGGEKAAAGEKAPAGKKAEAPAPAPAGLDLAGMPITGDAPAGAKAMKMGKKAMVRGGALIATVGAAGKLDAKDEAAATKEAEGNGGTNIKAEKLADGFLLTYENKGSAGSNYWVVSRRTIEGADYACGTTASQPAQQAAAVAFCKSLKKE